MNIKLNLTSIYNNSFFRNLILNLCDLRICVTIWFHRSMWWAQDQQLSTNQNTNYIGYPIHSNLINRKSNFIIFRFIETNDPKVHEEQMVPNNNRLHKRDTWKESSIIEEFDHFMSKRPPNCTTKIAKLRPNTTAYLVSLRFIFVP